MLLLQKTAVLSI